MELGLSIYMSLSPKCNVSYIWSILIKRNSNMDGNRLKIRFDHYIIHKEKRAITARHFSNPHIFQQGVLKIHPKMILSYLLTDCKQEITPPR